MEHYDVGWPSRVTQWLDTIPNPSSTCRDKQPDPNPRKRKHRKEHWPSMPPSPSPSASASASAATLLSPFGHVTAHPPSAELLAKKRKLGRGKQNTHFRDGHDDGGDGDDGGIHDSHQDDEPQPGPRSNDDEDNSNNHNNNKDVFLDVDKTPTRSLPLLGIPTRSIIPHPPPPQSTPRSARSSPTKSTISTIDLSNLYRPITFEPMHNNPFNQLPADVHALFRHIRDITKMKQPFLPGEMRQDIELELDDCLPDLWLTQPGSQDQGMNDNGGGGGGGKVEPTPMRRTTRLPRTRHEELVDELDRLCIILATSQECTRMCKSENSWNIGVHSQILALALRHAPVIKAECVTTARVAPAFTPAAGGVAAGTPDPSTDRQTKRRRRRLDGGTGSVSSLSTDTTTSSNSINNAAAHAQGGSNAAGRSKMVDFALVLALDHWNYPGPLSFPQPRAFTTSSPLDPARDRDRAKAEDLALHSAIRAGVNAQPRHRHVNQTSYHPLTYAPIGVSIETKASSGAAGGGGGGGREEARRQLGLWTAAWHARIQELMVGWGVWGGRVDSREGSDDDGACAGGVITLPLLLVDDAKWELYFACDRGVKGLEIIGGWPVGDTNDLLGLYQLLAVLRALAGWMETEFRSWIKRLFTPFLSP